MHSGHGVGVAFGFTNSSGSQRFSQLTHQIAVHTYFLYVPVMFCGFDVTTSVSRTCSHNAITRQGTSRCGVWIVSYVYEIGVGDREVAINIVCTRKGAITSQDI